MLIDYVSAEGLPRTWDHVAIVVRDVGTQGEFDPQDWVMHMGYLYGLTEGPASSEAPAVVQFLRWKPSVTKALTKSLRRRAGRAKAVELPPVKLDTSSCLLEGSVLQG
jgi:hypothetical protein